MTYRATPFQILHVAWFNAALAFSTVGFAETITIHSDTTNSEALPEAVAKSVASLAENRGEPHRILIRGEFAPSKTIKIEWWGEHPLTVSGGALLDGSKITDKSETIFLAGQNVTLETLRFVNSRGHAVVVGGGSEGYAVRDCVFEDCRQSAIHVWNDPETIEPDTALRGVISGNRIARFNLDKAKWANDGITVFDQRVRILRNHISDSPTESNGIRAMGRDLLIEGNVVKGVSVEDSGGIYLWGGPHASLFRGNVVRGNHVVGASRGIYLDDGTSGARVEENVVEDSSFCSIFISGGRDNIVERNVIDLSPVFLHIDSRCLGWDSRPEYAALAEESASRLRDALSDEPSASILRQRHPELSELSEEQLRTEIYGRPIANVVRGNHIRKVVEPWELMDFSTKVVTDFRELNELEDPQAFDQTVDLEEVSLSEAFGFQHWSKLKEAGPESVGGDK